MTDRDHYRCSDEDIREALKRAVRPSDMPIGNRPHRDDPASWPKPVGAGKLEPAGADVARTAMHILEVQGVDAVKDFLTRTIELDAARKSFTGNT